MCHYKLSYNIIAYKQLQYIAAEIATHFSMQEICFTLEIIVQACHAREVHN